MERKGHWRPQRAKGRRSAVSGSLGPASAGGAVAWKVHSVPICPRGSFEHSPSARPTSQEKGGPCPRSLRNPDLWEWSQWAWEPGGLASCTCRKIITGRGKGVTERGLFGVLLEERGEENRDRVRRQDKQME